MTDEHHKPRRGPRSRVMSELRGDNVEKLLGIRYGAPVEFDLEALRPKTRGECENGVRPCPWVSCRYSLVLDVDPDNGSIKINHPRIELEQLADTCALDVAERGGMTLEEVGEVINVTRERARQLEAKALRAYHTFAKRKGMSVETPGGFAHPPGDPP